MEEKSILSALSHRINFIWRLIATLLGFSLFGSGGLLLCLTIFPLIILITPEKHKREQRIRFVIRYTFKLYLSILQFLGLVRVNALGIQELRSMRGNLVICNHPSLLDVVIIMSCLRNVQCLVNSKLWSNPFVGLIVRSAGYIRNDISPELFLKDCEEMLARGENIIIFPEGTRSVPGKPIRISRGVANLALCAKADIQALTLRCSEVLLLKGAKWYDIPPKRADFLLEIGPKFFYESYNNGSHRAIRARALTNDILKFYEDFFNEQI